MRTYILRRFVHAVPVLWGVATVVWLALRLIPGDPAVALAGEKATAQDIENMRQALGLNQPLPVQYVQFLGHVVTLQFGHSIRTGGDISQELASNFAPTLELSIAALLIATCIGLPLGIVAAIRRHTPIEYGAMIFSLVGISMPVFWIGLMLIYLARRACRAVPVVRYDQHLDLGAGHNQSVYGGQPPGGQPGRFPRRTLASGPARAGAQHDHAGDHLAHGALEHARGAEQ